MRVTLIAVSLLLAMTYEGYSELATGNNIPIVRFKDGTILRNVKVHMGISGEWRPRADGLTLEVGGKIYFHHYPYVENKRTFAIPSSDDGLYKTSYVTRVYRVPTPRPPLEQHWNPNGIPSCVPSRIRFIHFDANTLNTMYKMVDATVKHYEKDSGSVLSHHYRAVRDSIRENAWYKLRPIDLNSPNLSNAWQGKVESEMRLHWRKIYYGKWLR